MCIRVLLLVLTLAAFPGAVARADTGIPWVGWIEPSSPEEVSLMIFPDGSGPPLSQARLFGGDTVDATITVGLIDLYGNPIVNFPGEDIWLDPENTATYQCFAYGGFMADAATDVNGQTAFASSLAGGGWSEGPIYVYLNGSRGTLPNGTEHPPVPLRFNSPDLNHDRVVNLTDVVIFAGDYFGAYHYRSDFYWDGVLNLTDIVMISQGFGISCD